MLCWQPVSPTLTQKLTHTPASPPACTQNLVDAVLAAEQGDNSFLPFATLPDVEFPTE